MTDVRFMEEALEEARRGWGTTHPNPMVGAVIVESEKVVSRGFHAKSGEPHAEINALNNLGRKPSTDAVLYVTLEPCSSTGKTGPCSQAILDSGLRKVVIGTIDPDTRHQGRGVEILRAAGVETSVGILAEACEDLNLIFNHVAKTATPFLAGKTATTLDGKVATRAGKSKWITGETARADVMQWRRLFPAIAVGSGTVLADDPRLTSRMEDSDFCPRRFIFDRSLRTADGLDHYQVYIDDHRDRSIVVTVEGADGVQAFEKQGIEVWRMPSDAQKFWAEFKARCIKEGITGVFFEGGAGLMSGLLAQKQLDYLFAYRAPRFLADEEAQTFVTGQEVPRMENAYSLSQVHHAILGDDQLMRGFVNYVDA
ncbi:MAG: bifunctional diaminohydroxyphosphoribosylaminopyrimidine deaminase/5-amino-6-(5-phosphoribosylamino)uracil reductase RibD [Verrucomicrobia bacterium]|nr:bifunctional diaminohydroxyphosphoribosylaminopyrimidine deaminase/5-amino-6-(5-phosphoribosylamino)uracil reductase RibD [Verrucomicrobiota bacterium]